MTDQILRNSICLKNFAYLRVLRCANDENHPSCVDFCMANFVPLPRGKGGRLFFNAKPAKGAKIRKDFEKVDLICLRFAVTFRKAKAQEYALFSLNLRTFAGFAAFALKRNRLFHESADLVAALPRRGLCVKSKLPNSLKPSASADSHPAQSPMRRPVSSAESSVCNPRAGSPLPWSA